VGHPEFQVGERSATGERKRYRRLRKKIVVPVVQAGKVEIRVKSFAGKEGWERFLNRGSGIEEFWKSGLEEGR